RTEDPPSPPASGPRGPGAQGDARWGGARVVRLVAGPLGDAGADGRGGRGRGLGPRSAVVHRLPADLAAAAAGMHQPASYGLGPLVPGAVVGEGAGALARAAEPAPSARGQAEDVQVPEEARPSAPHHRSRKRSPKRSS